MRGIVAERQLAGLFEAADSTSVLWNSAANPATAALSPRVKLFDLAFDNVTLDRAVDDALSAAERGESRQIAFVNAHVINTAARDAAYAETLSRCDTLLSDGSGMAIAAKLAGTPFIANTNGTDWFPKLAKAAAERGVRIFLLGAAPGVAERAAATIGAAGYARAIAGTHHGFFARGTAEEDAAIDAINASGADIVLAALGVPLQDTWLAANRRRIKAPVVAGVGGLFDFFAGRVTRAPKAMRAVGMEWAWRLAQEPGRLWRRYLIGNVTFMARAIANAMRDRRRAASAPVADAQTAA